MLEITYGGYTYDYKQTIKKKGNRIIGVSIN